MREHQTGTGSAHLGLGSLIDDIPAPGVTPRRRTLRDRLNDWASSTRASWSAWASATPQRANRVRLWSRVGAGAAVLLLAAGAFFALRPKPQPDYENDPFDDVLDYTLLTDGFNSLPVKERLALISDLVQRINGMGEGDSLAMAAFASGIAGEARKQLEKNASKLVMDVFDEHASGYAKADPKDREAALDRAYIDLANTLDALDGKPSNKSDEDRLKEANTEAGKGMEFIKKSDREKLGRDTGRMAATLNDTVAQHASPQQKARMGVMMRDMTRHFRGEKLD